MNSVLLDTDVFSYGVKRDTRAAAFAHVVKDARACIAFVTVAEAYRWALANRWGSAKRAALERSIGRCLVLPYDTDVARCWAEIMVARTRIGRPILANDCWIAAIAIRYAIPLVTNNRKDFERIEGLTVSP